MNTENLKTLKIHKLSDEQFKREKEKGTLDASALYLTPADDMLVVDLDDANVGMPNVINADTLGGRPASEYATENFVSTKIAEAQLGGGESGSIDMTGFATKDDITEQINVLRQEILGGEW